MGSDKNVQYECKVCGRKIDVTRIGDVNEEPVYCCGLESAKVNVQEMPPIPGAPVAAVKKPAKKKAKKKAAKKKAKKKAAKKKAKKRAVKKAVKKKAAKKAKKKAGKKKVAKKKKKAAKKKRK
jgi:type IV secretory pathway VirB10-like protein